MTADDLAWLREQFNRCRPWLQAALDRDIGTHDIDDVWQAIERGEAQFWPLAKSAIVTVVEDYPKGKALRWWLAGGELAELVPHESIISAWAIGQGCKMAFVGGRRGWVRALPGYHEAYSVAVKGL